MPNNQRTFVTKDNEVRYREGADSPLGPREESYETYNERLIKHEFVGLKIYGLVAHIPEHFYISKDDKKNLALNVEFLESSQSLREYLGIDFRKEISSYTDVEKAELAKKLNKLDGIGPLFFMGLLLGDNDMFGAGLDNVRVQGNQAVKIDASDVKLPFHDNESGVSDYIEVLSIITLESLSIIPHRPDFGGMPFVGFIFSLLDDEQKAAGLAAMKALTTDVKAAEQIAWLAAKMGYSEKEITKAVEDRAKLILDRFKPDATLKPSKINTITQTTIVRSAEHFQATGERIESGNSAPQVSKKMYSEKDARRKMLMKADGQLWATIQALNTKKQSLEDSNDKNKQEKITNIGAAIASFTALFQEMEAKLDNPKTKITRRDLLELHDRFNVISETLRTQLLTDKTEQGLINWLKRTAAQTSTIHVLKSQTKIFNNPLVTFFTNVSEYEESIKTKSNVSHQDHSKNAGSPTKKS